jgi:glutamate formiminotransferase
VVTFVGDAAAVGSAALALAERAIGAIDLRTHQGVHPRTGAVDVVPFVPLEGATMAECVSLAREIGRAIGDRFRVPVYLYGAAATAPARRHLADIRRGGFEGLAVKMARPGWHPDYGPSQPHATAGAASVGARLPLVAFNVNLRSDRLDVARAIAASVRTSGGGLPAVQAMGVAIGRGLVQVSMNLTDYRETSMAQAFDAVRQQAERQGVEVLESELVGLAPAGALGAASAAALRLRDFSADRILEHRLESIKRPDDQVS